MRPRFAGSFVVIDALMKPVVSRLDTSTLLVILDYVGDKHFQFGHRGRGQLELSNETADGLAESTPLRFELACEFLPAT